MSKRLTFLFTIAATLLVASTLSAASLGTSITATDLPTPITAAPAAPTSIVAPIVTPLVLPVRFEPVPMANACTSACQAQYLSCLDDCDKAPFPGCYNFCRFDVLYPCYGSCFS